MMNKNLFKDIPEELSQEFFEVLQDREALKIERIVSKGHYTPENEWYDQQWDEWVVLLTGAATLRVEGHAALYDLFPGDHILLPAHIRHRVEWTDPAQESVWLAVHFRPDATG
ncbi:cupin domain-containing protein [Candidatus Sororendozoicomonas aggregata]|uniref:cupin domain-containing protein n=1 Tax=Candidatus Sororendozoicomonas aggregata TaxID=3073239 RepID=UPI002ED07C8C